MSLPFQVKDVYVATSHNRSKAQGGDSCFCSFLLWLLPITGGLWGVQDSWPTGPFGGGIWKAETNSRWRNFESLHYREAWNGAWIDDWKPMCKRTNFICVSFQRMYYKPIPMGDLKLLLPFQKAIKFGGGRHFQDCLVPFPHFTDDVTDIPRVSFESRKSYRFQKPR